MVSDAEHPFLYSRKTNNPTKQYYAVQRKKELLPFATAWVELESIMLSEIQIPYDLTSK